MHRWLSVVALSIAIPSATCGYDDPAAAESPAARAARELITSKCLTCHDESNHKGELVLTRRDSAITGGKSGAAIVPGNPGESPLLDRLADGEMPPKNPLTEAQVHAFETWIREGAHYAVEPLAAPRAGLDWWSLQPITRPTIPSLVNDTWSKTPIDPFILRNLTIAGLTPSPEADRLTWLRRVTFDLTGLPPTPDELAAFASDTTPNAHARVVDRLLASPAYGERWGRHWLDVARFAESHGYETNALRPSAWPYRDWVIRARNEDLPFARFVELQFAGDIQPNGDWLDQAATGFLVGGTHDVVGNLTVEGMRQQRADDLDDLIAATGQSFLGLSVQCARCHDHKFDPISQRDYYGMKAIFAGVEHAEREVPAPDASRRREQRNAIAAELAQIETELDALEPLARPDLGAVGRPMVNPRRNVERFAPIAAKSFRFTVQATNNGIEPCIDELEIWSAESKPRNLAPSGNATASSTYPNSPIHKLEHINDGRYGNGRSWISAAMGKGWVQIDLPEVALVDRLAWGRDREAQFADRTPTEYYIEAATAPGEWRVVASSADRAPWSAAPAAVASEATKRQTELRDRQKHLSSQLATLADTIQVYAGSFRSPDVVKVLRRGDVMQEGAEAPPALIGSIAPHRRLAPESPEPERRRALASWISDPANPLPARVLVNRLWQYHFGHGLCSTSADFGFNGEKPSHPELLDWLASELLANGGQLKPIHRTIVLSATYRQSSQSNDRAQSLDAQNRLLWRFGPKRLEAESIRDAMLATSGTLDRRMGGPGYWIWEPNTNYVVVFNPLSELGPEHARRMVYQYKPRSQQDTTFGAFDCPDGAFVTTRRNNSTTSMQALNLFNSRFVLAQARAFAERLREEAGDNPEAQAERGFWLAFGRGPLPAERAAAAQLIRSTGPVAFCRALFNASEFLSIH